MTQEALGILRSPQVPKRFCDHFAPIAREWALLAACRWSSRERIVGNLAGEWLASSVRYRAGIAQNDGLLPLPPDIATHNKLIRDRVCS